jgi:V/A-type H+/Na+-transporting ATPase subunit D
MSVKLTKTSLREQQSNKQQLGIYLPTLKLKKSLLQAEMAKELDHYQKLHELFVKEKQALQQLGGIFNGYTTIDWSTSVRLNGIKVKTENLAGISLPIFVDISFKEVPLLSPEVPVWTPSVISYVRNIVTLKEKVKVAKERYKILKEELRKINIKVNLFEKILIPRTSDNIKKIQVFLSDQNLAQVGQAKMAKTLMSRKDGDVVLSEVT